MVIKNKLTLMQNVVYVSFVQKGNIQNARKMNTK